MTLARQSAPSLPYSTGSVPVMRGMILTCLVVVSFTGSLPAHADVNSYCEAFARGEADLHLSGGAIFGEAVPVLPTAWQRSHDLAFADCLAQYGSKAANPVAAAPAGKGSGRNQGGVVVLAPGSKEWKAYCAAKYASFNPVTGTYHSNSGTERPCVVTGPGRVAKKIELR
jgi:hypothetical protein